MNNSKLLVGAFFGLVLSASNTFGQYEFKWTFRGNCYETNGSGNVVVTPITEQTILENFARQGGLDPSTVAIVYHLHGNDLGDTIEVVNASNGSTYVAPFGLFFGDDASLGRSAITNSTATEIRRLDYVYTLNSSIYTSPNSHSMGAAFTTKRFLTDTSGNVHSTFEGPISWIVNPQNGQGTKICTGNYTTGAPLF
jgi:hypothetical protein